MKLKKQHGFSLTELVVVIVVISILVAISSIGMNIYLKDARDNERATKTAIIVEALEKYYDKNGEYPSCNSISASNLATAAAVLDGIDEQTFMTPQSSANSIRCTAVASATNDVFNYTSTPATPASQAQPNYILGYWHEDKGGMVTESSRRGN